MSTLAEDLRAELIADSEIATAVVTRVHYQHVPESVVGSYVWFSRSGSSDDDDRTLGDASGQKYHFRELWDMEGISSDLASAQALAGMLKKFDSHQSSLGDGSVQGIFVRDHTEDYIPRGVLNDDGFFVGAVQFEIIGYVPGS